MMTMVFPAFFLLAGTLPGFTQAQDNNLSPVENTNLTVTGCNVMVKTLSSDVIGASYANDVFKYEIVEGIHELTAKKNGSAMNIEVKTMPLIFLPNCQYTPLSQAISV